jgi:hypothetical protein
MKLLALGLLLTVQTAEPDLIAERRATLRSSTPHAMITVVATWADGSPVNKGWISCDGNWFKYADEVDEQITEFGLWFKTDARGAAIFNPAATVDDYAIKCRARKDGKTGEATIWIEDSKVYHIVINAAP